MTCSDKPYEGPKECTARFVEQFGKSPDEAKKEFIKALDMINKMLGYNAAEKIRSAIKPIR